MHHILPLPDYQTAFLQGGAETLRWHFGPSYPRPFFYPLCGPSGQPLTRMGHPGAPNHDHHRSVWFAHAKVLGIDFWSDRTEARIRQKEWLAYEDSENEAIMAVRLAWHDGHDPAELLEQELIAAFRREDDGTLLELQSTFTPRAEMLEFGKTNFGFLAVRMAKSISARFGGGEITSSEGARGEKNIFGRPAKWMDYSGPVLDPSDPSKTVNEGVTYFDHPSNPRYPSRWHVREDGWMGASVCMNEPLLTTKEKPLKLRYLLWAHAGLSNNENAGRIAEAFSTSASLEVVRFEGPHRYYEARRARGDE